MKLKVCGLTQGENLKQIVNLKPDYIGYIFFEKSPRFLNHRLPSFSTSTKKTGVFVNATIDFIVEKIQTYQLNAIQLHGHETPEFCQQLKSQSLEIIKAFGLDSTMDYEIIEPYQDVCDYFLFDTKTKQYGGSGQTFDWSLLDLYPFKKLFFISGGIDANRLIEIKNLKDQNAYLYGVDINSQFEIKPGFKDVPKIAQFKTLIDEL